MDFTAVFGYNDWRYGGTMTSDLELANDNSNEELINLAYSMAVEPQRIDILSHMLFDRLHEVYNDPAVEKLPNQSLEIEDIDGLTSHFERAFSLSERRGRRFEFATGSMRYIDSDIRPSLLVQKNGTIFHVNKAASETLGVCKGNRLDAARFEFGDYDRFVRDLKTIKRHNTDKVISVYNLTTIDEGEQIKLALSKAIDFNGDPIGRLSTFHIKWLDESGRQFQDSFDLTPIDIVITKAIVSGTSLNQLAKARGRSLGTIRNQTKALLAKLGLHSQVELACLYSGFTQYTLEDPSQVDVPPSSVREPWREKAILKLPGERQMQYEIVGPASGRPVLFFHAMLGGLTCTQTMREELDARNIRLIMVWRPSFGATSPDGGPRGAPQRFALDIERLLDHLTIETCQILAVISGALYAYACAQKMPGRISGIINCGSVIPIKTRSQLKQMTPAFRGGTYAARYTPKLLPMLMRAMVLKIDAGYDEEFWQKYFDHSPFDQDLYNDQILKTQLRDSYFENSPYGYLIYMNDLQILAGQWGNLTDGVSCPVTLIHGDTDPSCGLTSVEDFVKDKPNFILTPVPNAGQMLFYQKPDIMFSTLDEQYYQKSDEQSWIGIN